MAAGSVTTFDARPAQRPSVGNLGLWLGAVAAVAVLAYGPLLFMFFRQQWEKAHYQYFPFVIAAFGFLLWRRYTDGAPRSDGDGRWLWLSRATLLAAVGLLAVAILYNSPWGAAASLILLAGYGCLTISRSREIVNLLGIWLLLWLIMPAPRNLDQRLIAKLQGVSSRISSFALDAVGVDHLMDGNALRLPDKELFVDEACSGIISILSVVACAAIYAVAMNRTPLHLLLLACIGVGWATVINVGRISSIAYVYDRWGIDWSSGASHEILSLVLFMLTFLALLSTDVILSVLLAPVAAEWGHVHSNELRFGWWLARAWDAVVSLGRPEPNAVDDFEEPAMASESVPARSTKFTWWAPVMLFVPLAIVQGGLFAYAMKIAPERMQTVQLAMALTENDLPPTLAGLQRKGFKPEQREANSIHGKYSRTYEYAAPDGLTYVASFDFPFSGGWHELSECYTATGWSGVERRVRLAPKDAGEWPYVEADFEKPGEMFGTVLFTEFDQEGVALRPVEGWDRPSDSDLAVRNQYLETRKTMQVQVFVVAATPLTDAQRQQATALLLYFRKHIYDRVVVRAAAPAPAAPTPDS